MLSEGGSQCCQAMGLRPGVYRPRGSSQQRNPTWSVVLRTACSLTGRRPVAVAVGRRTQVRAALGDPAVLLRERRRHAARMRRFRTLLGQGCRSNQTRIRG